MRNDSRETRQTPNFGIQGDGGSEFRAEFEQACAELDIQLFVLPPDAPNSTAASSAPTTPPAEFRNRCDGEFTANAANRALSRYQRFYHQVRPRQALDMKTSDEYLQQQQGYPLKSHMC